MDKKLKTIYGNEDTNTGKETTATVQKIKTLAEQLEGFDDNQKIKVVVTATSDYDNRDAFISVGRMGANFKLGVPVELKVGIVKFMLDKEQCGRIEHVPTNDPKRPTKSVRVAKYKVEPV